MTVEIAIMNLEAVALASDSAVTASAGDNKKIFASQNKLFALTDAAPVGVLVYGGAMFMSIPWETLIKEYRHRHRNTMFPRLDDYAHDFCRFLVEDISGYISPEHQAHYAESLVRLVYEDIARLIDRTVSKEMDQILLEDSESAVEQFNRLMDKVTAETVNEYGRRARGTEWVEDLPEDFLPRIREIIRRSRRTLRNEIFRPRLEPSVVRRLNTIATRAVGAMVDDIVMQPTGVTTGIVIAGFGQDDLFPSYSEIEIEGLVLGVLKKRFVRRGATGPDNRAEIVSFAQYDMIYQFMQGIAPVYRQYLHASMISHLSNYTRLLLQNLEQYSDIERETLLERLRDVHPDIADSFVEQVEDIGRDHYAREIVDVVAMLPKDQLGEMAEALVSLTSLKRRVSLEHETVGGPTDVALITKGDGLVWIKRKHYFPADLNPAFFARKYRKGGTHHATEDASRQDN